MTGSADAPVSGTSFAAPVVAALLARRLAEPAAGGAAAVLAALQREARDLGAAGRDPVFGWGALSLPPSPATAAIALPERR